MVKSAKKPSVKGLKKYHIHTIYVGERINLKLVKEFSGNKFLNRNHPLVAELGEDKYAVLTKFGTVTFWNSSEEEVKRFLHEIEKYIEGEVGHWSHGDTLNVYVGATEEHFTFEDAYIKDIDIEKIKIISYVLQLSIFATL